MSTCTSIPCLTSILDPLLVSQLAQAQKANEPQLGNATPAIVPTGDTTPSTSAVFGAIAVSASVAVKPV